MNECEQEMCEHWGGDGNVCPCAVFGIERPRVAQEPQDCPCCLGDPDLVCGACGEHSCWVGIYMCWESGPAGVVTRAEFEEAQKEVSAL